MFNLKEEEKQRQIKEANEIFEKILKIASKIKDEVYYVPINLEEQKILFLQNKVLNPSFKYQKVPYNPEKEIQKLKGIKIKRKNVFSKFIRGIIKEKILLLKVVQNLGDSKEQIKISKKIYGKPRRNLEKKAKIILENLRKKKEKKGNIPSKGFTLRIKKAINSFGLETNLDKKIKGQSNAWKIIGGKKYETTIDGLNRTIHFCKKRTFKRGEIKRLIFHEIYRHLLSSENARLQPLNIFLSGTKDYLPTEEGLALYCEEKSKIINYITLKKKCGGYHLCSLALKGKNFRSCFEEMIEHSFNKEEAWEITKRIFYGGDGENPSSLKVQVYFKGYQIVKEFISKKGKKDLWIFWTGKFGISYFKRVKKLIKKGYINPPRYLPFFIKRN